MDKIIRPSYSTKGRKRVEDENRNKEQGQQIENSNMLAITPTISVITLNVNRLNASIKRQRLSEWIKKQDQTICCLQKTHLKYKDIFRLSKWV